MYSSILLTDAYTSSQIVNTREHQTMATNAVKIPLNNKQSLHGRGLERKDGFCVTVKAWHFLSHEGIAFSCRNEGMAYPVT